MAVEFVEMPTLHAHIRSGRFRHQLHLGLLAVAPLLVPEW
jgi:hypothetical protein